MSEKTVNVNDFVSTMLAGYTGEVYLEIDGVRVSFTTPIQISGSISASGGSITLGGVSKSLAPVTATFNKGSWTLNVRDGNIASMRPTISKVGTA